MSNKKQSMKMSQNVRKLTKNTKNLWKSVQSLKNVLNFKESHESLRTFQEHFKTKVRCLSKATEMLKRMEIKKNQSYLKEMCKIQWCFQQKRN